MPVDALATLGARASAGMVLTPKAGIFYLQHQKSLNLCGDEIRIFWGFKVNTKAADVLDSCITRSSAAIVLTVFEKQVLPLR